MKNIKVYATENGFLADENMNIPLLAKCTDTGNLWSTNKQFYHLKFKTNTDSFNFVGSSGTYMYTLANSKLFGADIIKIQKLGEGTMTNPYNGNTVNYKEYEVIFNGPLAYMPQVNTLNHVYEYTVPESVLEIKDMGLQNCSNMFRIYNLSNSKIGYGVRNANSNFKTVGPAGDGNFYNLNYNLASGIINKEAFNNGSGTNLKYFYLAEGIREIGPTLFGDNNRITGIVFPSTLTKLDKGIMYQGKPINTVVFKGSVEPELTQKEWFGWGGWAADTGTIYIPQGADYTNFTTAFRTYKTAENWPIVEYATGTHPWDTIQFTDSNGSVFEIIDFGPRIRLISAGSGQNPQIGDTRMYDNALFTIVEV